MESVFDTTEFNQNLFFPRKDNGLAPAGAEDISVEVAPSVHVHVRRYLNPRSTFSLLYFHGNGEIVADYDGLAPQFFQLGADLIVSDYRGYGKSSGVPTLRHVLEDSHKIYRFLRDHGKIADKTAVMGRSLGSASAIELCANYREIHSCIIESGYADPIPLVERRGLRIEKTSPEEDALFNNNLKIRRVRCPLLIMHGAEDFLIDSREAWQNYENAGSVDKALQIFEGVGHNDILFAPNNGYFNTLYTFFQKII